HVRRERIRLDDDGLSVIRNQDFKNALEELPGSFASLYRAWGRFFESGIHKAIARAHGGKDPGTKAPTLPGEQGESEPAYPAGVHLQFFSGLAVQDGNGRGGPSKLQLF